MTKENADESGGRSYSQRPSSPSGLSGSATAGALRHEISMLESQLESLRGELTRAEAEEEEAEGGGKAQISREIAARAPPASSGSISSPPDTAPEATQIHSSSPSAFSPLPLPLPLKDYTRYSRQMLVPQIGLPGQLRIRAGSALVVGLGGLGCPAAAYLAGAGVGTLGLMDGDSVEVSNLHRQILHSTAGAMGVAMEEGREKEKERDRGEGGRGGGKGGGEKGRLKVESARESLERINPNIKYVCYPYPLAPSAEALSVFDAYDLILDCTDRPSTRYLVSDLAVLANKPLISASALRTDGQMLLLNYPIPSASPLPPLTKEDSVPDTSGQNQQRGPCYRCIFPNPPPAESVMACGEAGILGPVVGVMGVLMALEAIKFLASKEYDSPTSPTSSPLRPNQSSEDGTKKPPALASTSLLLFSAFSDPLFRSVRIRGSKRVGCPACTPQSDTAAITREKISRGEPDYALFCGLVQPVNLLSPEERISPTELAQLMQMKLEETDEASSWKETPNERPTSETRPRRPSGDQLLLDVRDKTEFGICALPGSINIPYERLRRATRLENALDGGGEGDMLRSVLRQSSNTLESQSQRAKRGAEIFTICKLGNDSQHAVRKLEELLGAEFNEFISSELSDASLGVQRLRIRDVRGGFKAWREEVDPEWPDF